MFTTQRNFNGTTLTLAAANQGGITGMQVNQGGTKIDVFQPGDLVRLFELGIPVIGITVNLRGAGNQPTQGAKGAIAVTLGNGTALTLPSVTWQIMAVNLSGKEDGAWEGTVEYAPCPST